MERHQLDILSLFAGIVFVAIAVVGLTDTVTIGLTDLRWLGPAALVGFGVVLVMTAGSAVGRRGQDATGGGLGGDDADLAGRRSGDGDHAVDVDAPQPTGSGSPTDGTLPTDRVTPPDAASPSDE